MLSMIASESYLHRNALRRNEEIYLGGLFSVPLKKFRNYVFYKPNVSFEELEKKASLAAKQLDENLKPLGIRVLGDKPHIKDIEEKLTHILRYRKWPMRYFGAQVFGSSPKEVQEAVFISLGERKEDAWQLTALASIPNPIEVAIGFDVAYQTLVGERALDSDVTLLAASYFFAEKIVYAAIPFITKKPMLRHNSLVYGNPITWSTVAIIYGKKAINRLDEETQNKLIELVEKVSKRATSFKENIHEISVKYGKKGRKLKELTIGSINKIVEESVDLNLRVEKGASQVYERMIEESEKYMKLIANTII